LGLKREFKIGGPKRGEGNFWVPHYSLIRNQKPALRVNWPSFGQREGFQTQGKLKEGWKAFVEGFGNYFPSLREGVGVIFLIPSKEGLLQGLGLRGWSLIEGGFNLQRRLLRP